MNKKKFAISFDTIEQFIEMRQCVTAFVMLNALKKVWNKDIEDKELLIQSFFEEWESEKKRIREELIEKVEYFYEATKPGN